MAKQLFSNAASCYLGAAITVTTPIASITLETGEGAEFPSPSGGDWFVLAVWKADKSAYELFEITARSGDVLTVGTRAFDGSTAGTFATTDFCYCVANAGSFSDLQAAIATLEASVTAAEGDILTLQTDLDAAEVLIAQKPRMDIGTRAVFYQAAAPTGWTQVTSVTDKVLRVVDSAGGGTGGSWTISGVTVDSHTLTTGEIPSHTHGMQIYANGGTGASKSMVDAGGSDVSTGSAGGGGGHNHGLTADGAWRPAYADVIVAERAS